MTKAAAATTATRNQALERRYADLLGKAEALVSGIATFTAERTRAIEVAPNDHSFTKGGDVQAEMLEQFADALGKWCERQNRYNARRAERAASAA